MYGLLIFDHLNDVVYIYSNEPFKKHICKVAVEQRLLASFKEDISHNLEKKNLKNIMCLLVSLRQHLLPYRFIKEEVFDSNIIVQIFSPILTSHRIMATQFNNSYKSIVCSDGTTLVFKEHLGYIFLGIGLESEQQLERKVMISINVIQHIVGPCFGVLRRNRVKNHVLSCALKAWEELSKSEQIYLVEAIERHFVGIELSSSVMQIISSLVETPMTYKDIDPSYALIFVKNKLLALYSSQQASSLSSSDVLFLNLLIKGASLSDQAKLSHDMFMPLSPVDEQDDAVFFSEHNNTKKDICQGIVMLQSNLSEVTPSLVHFQELCDGIFFVLVSEIGKSHLSSHLYHILTLLDILSHGQSVMPNQSFMSTCELSIKQVLDIVRKMAVGEKSEKYIYIMHQIVIHWENVKQSGFEDWLEKTKSELPPRIEAPVVAFLECIRKVWHDLCLVYNASSDTHEIEEAFFEAGSSLQKYGQLLCPSKELSQCSLTVNRYLEEFPGLVHFLYIDRSQNLLTTPSLDLSQMKKNASLSEKMNLVTRSSVWKMVDFVREHLAKGHFALIWKNEVFNFSYFLWFEDSSGTALKVPAVNVDDFNNLTIPGIMCGDFYKQISAILFPSLSYDKLHVHELYCVHLGLVTSHLVLEHTRRIAATIWEIACPCSVNPADLI